MAAMTAEIRLIQLKTCFVNLPQSLVNAVSNSEATVQQVIVEIQHTDLGARDGQTQQARRPGKSSSYAGWTGLASASKDVRGSNKRKDGEGLEVVEIDDSFGRMLGLRDKEKVYVRLHLDPPLAHTIHVEPLTVADWEIIELHASFLESNLLFQVRALPNPIFAGHDRPQGKPGHPLIIHLSPTSTAKIVVSSLDPPQSPTVPFVRVAPDSEVIVSPKVSSDRGLKSHITQNGRSVDSKGLTSRPASIQNGSKQHTSSSGPDFFRVIDSSILNIHAQDELAVNYVHWNCVWIDQEKFADGPFRNVQWVSVSIVRASGTQAPLDSQQQQRLVESQNSDSGRPSTKVVAQLRPWNDAPDSHHCAFSPSLCQSLEVERLVGGIARVEAATIPVPGDHFTDLKFFPFLPASPNTDISRPETRVISDLASDIECSDMRNQSKDPKQAFLEGPLTEGMIVPSDMHRDGGMLRFQVNGKAQSPDTIVWTIGSTCRLKIDTQPAIVRPLSLHNVPEPTSEFQESGGLAIIGRKDEYHEALQHLVQCSSVLLTGSMSAGKSSLARTLLRRLRSDHFFHTAFFSCRTLVKDDIQISGIKSTFNRLFMNARCGTTLGGRALIVLDDIDKICPAETELQTTDNSRSKQVSELICGMVHHYITRNSRVVLLMTAQGKETLNELIIASNIVKDIVALKAPNKCFRRQMLETFAASEQGFRGQNGAAWLGEASGSDIASKPELDDVLDLTEIAGRTDGYMPGDLALLVSRAKHEAIVRSIDSETSPALSTRLTINDFEVALKNFTPASLRNVTLQTSSTTFDSIGGLHETRKVLLETLQYPTTYAPIFAQCPLRLRSGLLLYGYPGCGKTLLASAVAGECGLNFISVKGPEVLNKYIGASEKSIRDLFDRAESAKPCVLFFDEFDSIAPKRGHDSTGVTDRVVNQLLTQMDGAEGLSGVYVLAATSRPDLIDPALLRPGRLDKSLLCDMPGTGDRLDILNAIARKLSISPSVTQTRGEHENFNDLANRTAGYSGADLQAVVYNAHLAAIHEVLEGTDQMQANTGKRERHAKPHRRHDFLQFRLGDQGTQPLSDSHPSTQIAEIAALNAKLEANKMARRKEQQMRAGFHNGRIDKDLQSTSKPSSDEKGNQVTIEWRHIEASLATTRKSIGADERLRLARIYSEFTMSRNGKMFDGEGSTEIGGRSTLM